MTCVRELHAVVEMRPIGVSKSSSVYHHFVPALDRVLVRKRNKITVAKLPTRALTAPELFDVRVRKLLLVGHTVPQHRNEPFRLQFTRALVTFIYKKQ